MKEIVWTPKFESDIKKIKRSGIKYQDKLREILMFLSEEKSLPRKYKDHKLQGKLNKYRECHIKHDLLLVYEVKEEEILLYGIGSHSSLFD